MTTDPHPPGSCDDFIAALERLRPRLAAFVRRRLDRELSAKESASDVVQSVFREVLQAGGRIDFEGDEALRAWLFSWAAHKIRDKERFWHARRRDVRREVESPAASTTDTFGPREADTTPSREAILHEHIERIEAACDRLAPDHRVVIRLSRLEGLSLREISQRLGRSEAAVKMLLHRAMVRLTTELRQLENDLD